MDINTRLIELKAERDKGQRAANDLQNQLNQVQINLMRIDGAIAILDELLTDKEASDNGDD